MTRDRLHSPSARRRRLAIALGLTAGIIFGACGSDEGTDADSNTGSDQGSEVTTESEGSEAADADQPAQSGGTLRFGRSDITTFDPHKSTVGPDAEILFITYDRLIHQDASGTLVPGLAESWEISDDGLTLTLRVRDGVTFHDGTPLDADAVVANLDRALTLEDSSVKAELASISEVVATDASTVEVQLSTPASNLPAILSDRAGALVSPAAFENEDLDRRPVGAGMYSMDDYVAGTGATFEKVEDYWDPDAQRVDEIDWTVLGDSEALFNALNTGQIDVATLPPANIDRAERSGLQIVSGPTRQVYYLNLNETREGLDDVRVRQAIAQSINRQGLVDAVFFGHAEPASQLLPPGEVGHNPDIASDAWGFDPDGAKELLAEAGFQPGDLQFELIGFGSAPVPEINQVIVAGLGEAGIEVSITTVDVTAVADTYFVRAEGDMMQGAWSGRPSAEQTIQLLHSSTGFGNPGGYAPDGFDDLLGQALAATSDEEREAALNEVAMVGFDDVLSVPLVFPYTTIGAQQRVTGLEVYVAGKLEFRGVGIDD